MDREGVGPEQTSDASGPCLCSRCRALREKEAATPKRFKVGDRVMAIVDGWRPCTITQLDYREDEWETGRVSAYQILLDSACRYEMDYVHAPEDVDGYVRAIPKSVDDCSSFLGRNCSVETEKCCGSGEQCPLYHVCRDTVKCPKYHFCGRQGRRKTMLWRKLAERDAMLEGEVGRPVSPESA